MKGDGLPVLIIRLVPGERCIRCGQRDGYVHDKSMLCPACLNISLLVYLRRCRENAVAILTRCYKTLLNLPQKIYYTRKGASA